MQIQPHGQAVGSGTTDPPLISVKAVRQRHFFVIGLFLIFVWSFLILAILGNILTSGNEGYGYSAQDQLVILDALLFVGAGMIAPLAWLKD